MVQLPRRSVQNHPRVESLPPLILPVGEVFIILTHAMETRGACLVTTTTPRTFTTTTTTTTICLMASTND